MTVTADLSAGWTWATIEDIAAVEPRSITDGPFGSNLKTEHYTASGARVVRLQNIGDGVFRDDEAFIGLDHYERLQAHNVRAGDVLIASLGDELPRACLAPDLHGPAIVKADCIRLRVHRDVSSEYIMWALNSAPVRASFKAKIHGLGRPRLNLRELRGARIPLAPVEEQRRIVAALEERLSQLEFAVTEMRRLQRRLLGLQDAVLARLVDDSGSVRQPLGELIREPLRNGLSARASADPDGIRILTLTAVTRRDFGAHHSKVTSASPDKARGLWCESGDIFIQRSNTPELVGTAAMYTGPSNYAIFPDLLIRVRVKEEVDPRYLELVLRAPQTRQYFRQNAQGLAGSMPKISQATITSLQVPVLPLAMQQKLRDRAAAQIDTAKQADAALKSLEMRCAALRRAVLQAAFNGGLTEQSHTDEAADVLLKRIDEERVAAPTARRGRRAVRPSRDTTSAAPVEESA